MIGIQAVFVKNFSSLASKLREEFELTDRHMLKTPLCLWRING